MLRRHVGWLLFVLMLATALTGCIGVPPTAQPQISPITPLETSSANASIEVSPVATPGTDLAAEPAQPGTGVVKATLHRFDGSPIKASLVYAALIEVRGGMKLSAVDPLADPRDETDPNGIFIIKNLKPGDYALAMQSPVGIIMPHNRQGSAVYYQVKADETTDLGQLEVGYNYPDS